MCALSKALLTSPQDSYYDYKLSNDIELKARLSKRILLLSLS